MSNPGDRAVQSIYESYMRGRANAAMFSPYADERAIARMVVAPHSQFTPHPYPSPASYRHAAMVPSCADKGPPCGFRGLGYLGVTLARRTPQTGWQRLAWAWLFGRVARLWLRRCWTWVEGPHYRGEGITRPCSSKPSIWQRTLKPIPWRKMVKPICAGLTLTALVVANVLLNITYWRNR